MSSPTSSPEDSPMSSHEDSPMSSDDDSPMSSHEDSPMSSDEDSPMSSPDDSELICSCGLPAKLIISRNRSPYRLFYNCPRGQYNQCGFRQWFDETMQTDNQHVDQINLISIECIQLQERINEIEEERGQERSLRFKERAELNSQLSAVKDELNKIKSKIKPVNKSNPTSAGVTFQTMSMSSPEDSPISSYEDSPMSSPEGSSMSSPENSEVICFCGRLAKLRLSMTSKNPNRYFYNCPKRRNNQCDFFQWFDEPIPTGDRCVDEMNLISSERNRLQERADEIKEEWDQERSLWNKEKMELHLPLSALKDELNKIKSKIKQENDGLDKIKSEIKLENDGLVKIKSEIKLENDGLDNIKSEIKLENDGLDNIKTEIKLENDGLDIKTEIKLENESGSMPPLN
ncbi:uncharacterized protein LOC131320429 [Rhododendron vialii]|uniref:uncharacterized protein LOC131320429 n=1 Tax=Rhododendron vialii TaxID=182163 RepID=UPI00265E2211|nr:uncharacterized protein LOC131320429 [Rhododendron vialii]XP_058207117.1 uncharacterized protein LOC131320429 [Rhododendron vialii]XP_058207118.1 uncharacterized protein LOC131320429 [Rhododendron vialii]XP_058207119.1 uncharacterized protein LOC131320429 [Rhododendron vialii]XP_058207120.1 uncharacterized protein LOC131320429 [Rhododendron vialii]XP_058207121.1 uncharacterized protein LOC131320429 [Rhododendron vialii]XP_058207122.1 uncharacterized protein LOC131320429 [Rhododendron viali